MCILCRVLDVSVSGFYAWKHRPLCTRKREDGDLATRIEETFVRNRQVYGSPRIHAERRTQGFRCGRKRVVRLMQQLNLSARCPKRHVVTTKSDPAARFAPNMLQQQFEALAPNTKWVADVTFIGTKGGWLSLAAVLDLFSRAIVGWAMAAVQDEALVTQALQMALARRDVAANLLHHSDRGSQYTSDGYQQLLASQGIQVSMSRTGNCYDNAVMERFFGTLKRECTSRYVFETHEQARSVVFEFIECFSNRIRRHSSLDYLSPVQFEMFKS
jgi:transposase InsO family protein